MRTAVISVFLGTLYTCLAAKEEVPAINNPSSDQVLKTYYREGDTIILPCVSTGLPVPSYNWSHNGQQINKNTENIQGGNLTITNAQQSEEGDYQCEASNKFGKSLSQIFTLTLVVLSPFPDREVEGIVGQPLTLKHGDVWSKPPPTYTWSIMSKKNEKILPLSNRVIKDLKGNLHFTSVEPGDALEENECYKVRAFSPILDSKVGGRCMKINVRPSIGAAKLRLLYPETRYTSLAALKGEEMKIQCIFSGSSVDITWTGPTTTQREMNNTIVRVPRMRSGDQGLYTCIGTNQNERLTAYYQVNMEAPPRFIDSHGKQAVPEGGEVTLRCETTEDTIPQAIVQWIIDGNLLHEPAPSPNMQISKVPRGKTLTISKLRKGDDPKVIQCRAQNRYGIRYKQESFELHQRTEIMPIKGPGPTAKSSANITVQTGFLLLMTTFLSLPLVLE